MEGIMNKDVNCDSCDEELHNVKDVSPLPCGDYCCLSCLKKINFSLCPVCKKELPKKKREQQRNLPDNVLLLDHCGWRWNPSRKGRGIDLSSDNTTATYDARGTLMSKLVDI